MSTPFVRLAFLSVASIFISGLNAIAQVPASQGDKVLAKEQPDASQTITNNGFLDRNGEPVEFGGGFGRQFLNAEADPKGSTVLSINNRANKALREEILQGVDRFDAKAGWGYVLDVNSGEIIALASIEDPKRSYLWQPEEVASTNRVTQGIYETGSVARLITIAMALDAGKVDLNSKIDAKKPIKHGRFTIRDYHPQDRMLSVAEVFYYSSNIGSARLAQKFSVESQREYLSRMGQLDLLDAAPFLMGNEPLFPKNWSRLSSLTISFGHGIAATPLQAGIAIAALVNGGRLIKPTLVKQDAAASDAAAKQVISAQTSENIRYLLRRGAEIGAARTVDVDGYYVGGTMGTANKVVGGKYSSDKIYTTFISAFPMDKPQYLLLVMLDEPQGNVQTQGYRTAAWNVGQITGRIIERVAPILGVERRPLPSTDPFPNSTKATGQRASVPGIQASAAD